MFGWMATLGPGEFCYSVLPRVGYSGEAFGEPRYARYAFSFWGKPPSHLLVVSPGRARSSLARQRGWQTTGVYKHHPLSWNNKPSPDPTRMHTPVHQYLNPRIAALSAVHIALPYILWRSNSSTLCTTVEQINERFHFLHNC